jgi:hypothetical protein
MGSALQMCFLTIRGMCGMPTTSRRSDQVRGQSALREGMQPGDPSAVGGDFVRYDFPDEQVVHNIIRPHRDFRSRLQSDRALRAGRTANNLQSCGLDFFRGHC